MSGLISAGPWHPDNLYGSGKLKAWWSADDTSLIAKTGSNVSSWTDHVGGIVLTAESSPIWAAMSFNEQVPGVAFDGTDDCLRGTSFSNLPTGASPSEVWAVCEQTALAADATSRTVFDYGGTAANEVRRLRRAVVTSVNRVTATDGTALITSGGANGIDFTSYHIVRVIWRPSSLGLEVDRTSFGTDEVASLNTGTLRASIGASNSPTASLFYKGQIRHVLVFGVGSDNALLKPPEAERLYDWLSWDSGLSI
jgi:hypothetical protein